MKPTLYVRYFILFLALNILPSIACGQLRLPALFSDGMVLQRNAETKIWGGSEKSGEQIRITFRDSVYQTTSNHKGQWQVILGELRAGGPHQMVINNDTIRNVRVGDVWVSSGQSNMELPMERIKPKYAQQIASARNSAIRYLDVRQSFNFQYPDTNLNEGKWKETSPDNVLHFSAVAYFFADQLYERYGVPIGIINASVGGSPAQAWISEDALKDEFPGYYQEMQPFKDSAHIDSIRNEDQRRRDGWYDRLNRNDRGYYQGRKPWYAPELETTGWDEMSIPGYWNQTALGDTNGVVWFRKNIKLPDGVGHKQATLEFGRIVDADSVFVNGTFVGSTTYQYPPRRYTIPEGLLHNGDNTLAVRVINERGSGGFLPDKSYALHLGQNKTIDLKGAWKFRLGTAMDPLQPQTFIRWKPAGLYNSMIAPLHNYAVKGVIWYQGESNTGRPDEYEKLFSLLIKDWRQKWGQEKLPFLYVQLANFMTAREKPRESNWAELRESQRNVLNLPNTGMAVAIDIGEWNDIHPLNKKAVGDRLALAARKVAYNEEQVVYSGPAIASMHVDGSMVKLNFKHTGSGLRAKGAILGGFAIAGEDRQFVWASARIEDGDRVVVWADEVKEPVFVRYGWADNPINANLYNKEGLPASPFEIRK